MTLLAVDLTNCEREPIHILGHIQSLGYLVAIQPETIQSGDSHAGPVQTYTIVHVSDNIADLVGVPPEQVLGQPVDALLTNSDLPATTLIGLLDAGRQDNDWAMTNPHRISLNGADWNLIIHQHDHLILLEWEPIGDDRNPIANQQLLAQALTEVQVSRTLRELLQNTARRVKTITGYERVMVYRFGPDWHGQVMAEEKDDHLEPYMDLHFPASDIPRQARELYKINLVRQIADVGSQPSRLLSAPDWPTDRPLDMTHSVLRAVSTVHIQYLKNMGVQASMSISLLYRGELWGLISCHNSTPRFVDFPARQAAKFVSQLLSAALEFRKDAEDQNLLEQYRQSGQQLHQQLLLNTDIVQSLTKSETTLLGLTSATAAAVLFNNQIHTLGKTPPVADIRALADWLKTADTDTFMQTHQLPKLYPPAEAYRAEASGLLAVVLSKEMNEYLLWFKPERIQQVTWAGNPDKPVTVNPNGQRQLSPRTSFAAWTETVRNTSNPWTESEVTVVVKLREDVLQVVTRQANEIRLLNQRLQAAYEELDAFSYTVSHDLRTPLSSIRCYSEILLEEYGHNFNDDAQGLFQKVIDSTDRMRSLIRHILYYSRMGRTDLNTQTIDMQKLVDGIREEIMVTAKDRSLRIEVSPLPPLTADPTMITQVFTNLLSNAAKYTQLEPEALVRVTGQQTDSDIIYTIEDNGIGFDMKNAGKMFDLFKRLENARSFEGSGVGLAIVKRIINRHQGKIWFHSEPNRGSTFSISFPINRPE